MAKRKIEEYPELVDILARLQGGIPDEMISIFIPSHDRRDKPVPDQDIWAGQALDLFGKLYGGGTSFGNLSGIKHDD